MQNSYASGKKTTAGVVTLARKFEPFFGGWCCFPIVSGDSVFSNCVSDFY